MKRVFHFIAKDIGGNLGLAWTIEFWNWKELSNWMKVWKVEKL